MKIETFDCKAVQTRDDWRLQITVEVSGMPSKATAAYIAGQLSVECFTLFGIPPEITHNFDEGSPEGRP
jgi:hypothetical protein